MFAKFPDLTVVLMESGVTWLPGYLWRLTKFWKGLRSEVPWVADPPATIVRERVRLTLQPFDGPPDPATITRFMEHMGSDELLLFSTDYPHWQFEGTDAIPQGLDPALARKIMVDNPLRTYVRSEGDSDMNVDVLNRSGAQPAAPVEARHRRLRRASAPGRRRHRRREQVALPVPVEALAGARRDDRRALSPAVGEGFGLSEGPAAGLPPRCVAERRYRPAATWRSWPSSTWTRTTSRWASSIR